MKCTDNGVTLAIAPTWRGFGYVVFENPDLIMDWGVKDERLSNTRDCLLKARVLMHMLQPSVLVLEDTRDKSSRRGKRVKALIQKMSELAKSKGVSVVRYSRHDMLTVFERMGARSKDDIARAVAKLVPELAPRLPPRRRVWESEHHSMAIFEAGALAITHFAKTGELRAGAMIE